MRRILMVSLLAAFLSIAAFAQNKSVYTSLAADKCKTASVDQGMPGNYSGKCPGVAGFALEAYLDDERNSVGVVLPNKKVVGLGPLELFHKLFRAWRNRRMENERETADRTYRPIKGHGPRRR
jgi:hypothetical protein